MALRDPFKDKLGSHKLREGVWKVQASLSNLFGGDWGGSDSATGLEIPAGSCRSMCTVRLVLSRSLFLFPDIIYSSNQMLEMGKDLVEIGKDFLAPCSSLAPPHCDCGVFQACLVLGLARGRGRYRRVCGAQKLHVLGVEGSPQV